MSSVSPVPVTRGDILEVINATIEYLGKPEIRRATAIEALRLYMQMESRIDGEEGDDSSLALRVAVNRAAAFNTSLCSEMDPITVIVVTTLNTVHSYSLDRQEGETPVSYTRRKLEFVRDELAEQQKLGAPEEHLSDGG